MGQQSITPPSRRLPIPLWITALLLFLSAPFVRSQILANTLPIILPSAIAYDAQGNLYIAEVANHVILRADSDGLITTIAGTGTQGFFGDGGPAIAARLDSPQGLALDPNNNLYISDTHNHRVRKLDLSTGLITTVAGTGISGFSGDSGPATAARLDLPTALVVDSSGDLYIVDTGAHRIREIAAATGLITTLAGNGTQGFSGDNGPATAASIDSPGGLAIDAAGDLYLSDTHNHRIRKIAAATGIITTMAGTGAPGYSGDSNLASSAKLNLPHGLSIDSTGNLYIADTENHRIRRIDAATGKITTVAGNGTQTFSGDNGPARTAGLDSPRAITVPSTGLVTLADTDNQRIRQLDAQPIPAIHTIAGISSANGNTVTLTAPPSITYGTGQLTAILASSTDTGSVAFSLVNPTTGASTILGSAPLTANRAVYDISTLPAGNYTFIVSYAGDSTHAAVQSLPLSLRITPRPLFVTANAITLLYGQSIPSLNGSISGLLAQDSGNIITSFSAPVTASSPAGVYPISASIAGTSAQNYTLHAVPADLTIRPAPTITTLGAPVTSIASGTPLTLTAHIASTTAGIPTGMVNLMDGATPLLSLVSSSGSATFSASNLAPGPHTLTTIYAGDKNFISSTSAPVLINVSSAYATSPDFTLTSTGATSQTIPSGGSVTFNFNVQIQGSTLSSPINLSATGLPVLATASFNPSYLPPGTTPNSFALTISTPQTIAFNYGSGNSSTLFALLLFPIAGMAFRLGSCPKAKGLVVIVLSGALPLLSGCGSRINIGNSSTTPPKAYAITVTGTATSPTGSTLQHSTTVKLLIQSGASL